MKPRLMMERILVIIAGTIVLAFVGGIKARQLSTRTQEMNQQRGEVNQSAAHIQLMVKRQSGSPLLIKRLSINANDSSRPQVDFLVENRSLNPISAYAIGYVVAYGGSTADGVSLTAIASRENLLQPNESRPETVDSMPTAAKPIARITLIVDFVEFVDGSVWGPDSHQSAERLSGHRAGLRAASEYYLKLLELRGPSPVIQAYESGLETIPPPQGHTQKWEEGFRSGTDTVRARLQHGVKIGTSEEVKTELRKITELLERR